MKIKIFQGNTKIPPRSGALIIIDVLRAGTTAFYILNSKIDKCILAKDKYAAFGLAKIYDAILIGEKNGYMIEGFDLGNSPYEISADKKKLYGKNVVFLTSNGVATINNNIHFSDIYFCGYANAEYTANYLKDKIQDNLTIIASHPTSDDDLACAEYIKALITGTDKVDENELIDRIKKSESAQKFYNNLDFPIEDLNICCSKIDDPGFVIQARIKNGNIELTKTF